MIQKLQFLLLLLIFPLMFFGQSMQQPPPAPCGWFPVVFCDRDLDGFIEVDLREAFPFNFCHIDPSQSSNYYSLKYYLTEEDANSSTNAISNPENYVTSEIEHLIYKRADPIDSADPILISYDSLGIGINATPNNPIPLIACESENAGFAIFNLSSKYSEILSGQKGYLITFHETYEDALNLLNPVDTEYSNTMPNQQIIYASISLDSAQFEDNCIEVVELELIVNDRCDDISVELIRISERPRPGFYYVNRLYISNEALTTVESGTVQFVYDDILQYHSASVSNSDANIELASNGFNVNFSNLEPNESFYVDIYLIVPSTTALGTVITNSASYITPENDINSDNDDSVLTSIVEGSYDPNDIMESHGPQILHDDFINSNEYFYYTIRFQNIGTAEAITVRIEDVLDNQLDESTFQMLRSSHNYSVNRWGANLEWKFENINLPAEQDDAEGSNGFVYFKIKPKSGYTVGDIIPNSASIYFDFNAPIITNTFETTFVETLSIDSYDRGSFIMYPNPSSKKVTIQLLSNFEDDLKLKIYDVQGKLILDERKFNSELIEINTSELSMGLYFVKLLGNNLSVTQKLIIK